MSKNIRHILNGLFALTTTNVVVISSCAQNPIEKILSPDQSIVDAQLSIHNATVATFNNFKYDGYFNPRDIVVNNTFKSGFASFESSISGWNATNKTFSVKLVIRNVFATSVSGEFSFLYRNKPVSFNSKEFTVNLVPYTQIIAPENLSQTITLSPDGNDIYAVFENFKYKNFRDLTLLNVSCDFQSEGVLFEPTIINPTETTFDVSVKISNAKECSVTGSFSFTYNDILVVNSPTEQFTININDSLSINVPPTYTINQNVEIGDIITVKFHHFSFTGDFDASLLKIENTFSSFGSSFRSYISDINYTNKTFSVAVDCDVGSTPDKVLTSSFKFYYNNHRILSDNISYNLNLMVPVPDNMFNIELDSTTQRNVLKGFNATIDDLEPYNTVSIPSIVNEIGAQAFQNNEAFNSCITFLNFDKCINLQQIGRNAFDGCYSIRNELVLPNNSLTFIGSEAFKNCNYIPGSLVLPNNVQKIETNAFENCSKIEKVVFNRRLLSITNPLESTLFNGCSSLKMIDLSMYDSIPEWISTVGNAIFGFINSNGGQVYIGKSKQKDWEEKWSEYIFSERYCYLQGDWSLILI